MQKPSRAVPHRRLSLLAATAGLMVACFASVPATAQTAWPSKPIRIVVPIAAGGAADTLARKVADALSARLGQPVIVENRPGVGGNLGTDVVAKSPPDGYTLLMTNPVPITQAIALYKKLPYDPRKDLVMISDVAQARVLCVTHPDFPAKTFRELLIYAKLNPGKVSIGSWGNGSQPHMIQAYLDLTYGISTIHIPYKGEAPMIANLIGGQISMTCGTVTALRPFLEAGKARAIATVGASRAKGLPNVPTFAEVGYPDPVLQLTGPISVLAPAKTPRVIVERLGRELAGIAKSAEMVQQIDAWGMESLGSGPAEANAAYKARLPLFLKAVRDTGTTLD